MKQITTTVCATMLMASCGNINNTEQQVNQQVDELYSRMSQPERIAQLKSGYMDELLMRKAIWIPSNASSSFLMVLVHFSSTPVRNWLMPISCESVWLLYKIGWYIIPQTVSLLFFMRKSLGINTEDATVYPEQWRLLDGVSGLTFQFLL